MYAVANGALTVLAEGQKRILSLADASVHPELLARYLLSEIIDELTNLGDR